MKRLIVIALLVLTLFPAIAYTQEESPTQTQTPPPSPTPALNTNDISEIITPSGLITESIPLSSADGRCNMVISANTRLLAGSGEPIQYIELQSLDEPPVKLPGEDIGSIAYYFGPEGTTLDPPSMLAIKYNSVSFPEGIAEEDLLIVYLDSNRQKWIEIPDSTVNVGSNTITTAVDHLATFAIRSPSSRSIPFNLWLIPLIVLWLAAMFKLIVYINSRMEKKK